MLKDLPTLLVAKMGASCYLIFKTESVPPLATSSNYICRKF